MKSGHSDGLDQAAVLAALDQIVASGSLGSNSRLIPLLKYVVSEELEGRGDRIKAYSIATDVFGRGIDFDANTDSIVRVEFRRLRQSLEHYYLTKGSAANIRIEFPSGTYRPILKRTQSLAEPTSEEGLASTQSDKTTGVVGEATSSEPAETRFPQSGKEVGRAGKHLMVFAALIALVIVGAGMFHIYKGDIDNRMANGDRKFVVVVPPASYDSTDRTLANYASGLRDRVLAALSQQQPYTTSGGLGTVSQDDRRLVYTLLIHVQHRGLRVLVTASLTDHRGEQIWADSMSRMEGPDLLFQDQIVHWLVTDVKPHVMGAVKREIAATRGQVVAPDVWDLYVDAAFLSDQSNKNLESEEQRIASAQKAVALKPDFGQAHALLAQLQAHLTNVHPPSDTAEARREAAEHAAKGLVAAPQDADAMYDLGFYNWSIGKKKEAVAMARRAIELDPFLIRAQVLVELAEYNCSAPPRGPITRLQVLDSSLSPDNPGRWMLLTALSQLSLNSDNTLAAIDYARKASVMHRGVESIILYAALLNRRGKRDDARAVMTRLRLDWPNIDLKHYAEVVVPRLCNGDPLTTTLSNLYRELAAAEIVTSTVPQ